MHPDLINTPYLPKILTYFKKWFGTPIASVKCYGGHFLNSHLKSHLIIKIQYKMENINFSHNWNGKLKNKVFTTIRLLNNSKYVIGNKYNISLKYYPVGIAEIVDIKYIKISEIDNFSAMLDTGYSAFATRELIKQMYKNKSINWENQLLAICLLKFDHVENPDMQCKIFKV